MEQEFVSYEQAVALKDLGFDKKCLGWYSLFDKSLEIGNIRHSFYTLAPLKQQVFRWFRDNYEFLVIIRDIEIIASDKSGYRWKWIIFRLTDDIYIAEDKSLLGSLTYEQAENACIDKLIELAKQQDK
jgi:hypothetical protein